MSYPEGVNRSVNHRRIGIKKRTGLSRSVRSMEFHLSAQAVQAADKIPRVLALAAARVRLLTPSFP